MTSGALAFLQPRETARARFVAVILAVALLAICAAVGALTVSKLPDAMTFLALCGVLAFVPLFIAPRGFERATAMMLLTLPLYSAFVVDFGFTVRLTYIFGAAALMVAGIRHRLVLTTLPRDVWMLLTVFLCAVIGSIVVNPVTPVVPALSASGLRGIPGLRPLAQVAQLLLMTGLMLVTVSYCRSRDRLIMASHFIVFGGMVAVIYAIYFFAASYARVPFVDLNNAMNTDYSFGYKPQDNSYVGGTIPRPRSTFPEPANFANFLLLIMPLMFVRFARATRRAERFVWGTAAGTTMLLFIFAVNSRGAIFGAAAAMVSMVLFLRNMGDLTAVLRRFGLWGSGLALTAALFVLVFFSEGLPAFIDYFVKQRLGNVLDTSNRVGQDWPTIWAIAQTHPVFGIGFGNLTYYIGQIEGTTLKGVTDAGGLYQRLLAEVGFFGTLFYVLFIASILGGLWRIGRTSTEYEYVVYARALFFAIAADAIQRVSIVGLATDAYLWVALGLGIALIHLAGRESIEHRVQLDGRFIPRIQ